MADKATDISKSQIQRFKEVARQLGTDESEEAFDRVLKKVGSAPPAPVHKSPEHKKGAAEK